MHMTAENLRITIKVLVVVEHIGMNQIDTLVGSCCTGTRRTPTSPLRKSNGGHKQQDSRHSSELTYFTHPSYSNLQSQ